MKLTAGDQQDLQEIEAVMHDSFFDSDYVVHDAVAGEVRVPFAQDRAHWADSQRRLVKRTRLYDELDVPFLACVLAVGDVRRVEARDGWGDMGMLVDLDYEPQRRRLVLESNGKLVIDVARLSVVVDLGHGGGPARASSHLAQIAGRLIAAASLARGGLPAAGVRVRSTREGAQLNTRGGSAEACRALHAMGCTARHGVRDGTRVLSCARAGWPSLLPEPAPAAKRGDARAERRRTTPGP